MVWGLGQFGLVLNFKKIVTKNPFDNIYQKGLCMAEAERFELSVGYKPTPVFKTGAFNRSAKLPMSAYYRRYFVNCKRFLKNFGQILAV